MKITINNREYIKVDLTEISQKDERFFVGKLNAAELLDIYTVNPVEYDIVKQSALLATYGGDEEYLMYLLDEDERKVVDYSRKGFNREYDTARVKDIGEFLDKEDHALFPNTIIVTCDLLNNYIEMFEDQTIEDVIETVAWPNNLAYLEEKDGRTCIYIPNIKNSLVIVDGQHRMVGLQSASMQVRNNYDVLLSFIIGYDRSVIAKLFYTINYTQKSVNKSLLYHLTGEFSGNVDEITFFHEVIKVLNESKASPFLNRIKMLGKVNRKETPEVKRLLTVSQSFLIDYLAYTITPRNSYGVVCPIFYYYYKNKNGVILLRFLARYFLAIKEIFHPQWDNPETSILSKTTGVGAFIKVLNYFFIKLAVDESIINNPALIDEFDKDRLVKLLSITNTDLSIYSKAGGAGKLNELMKDLILRIGYFEANDYKEFNANFKKDYVPTFVKWVNSVS